MELKALKTRIITLNEKIEDVLDEYILPEENTILAITSKLISFCEGRAVDYQTDLTEIVHNEADFVINGNEKNSIDTVVNGVPMPNAGIDKSNGNGNIILLPKSPFESAANIHAYLIKKFNIENFGVIITDSEVGNFHKGTIGFTLAWAGFKGYIDYRGTPDLFDRPMTITISNIIDKLASAAVLEMGEGNECKPFVIVKDIPFLKFCKTSPSIEDIQLLQKESLYDS